MEKENPRFLVIGAGVTGCHLAWRLQELGQDVHLLARGEKAERLRNQGLRIKNGITGEETKIDIKIVEAPIKEEYELALVCVQQVHRAPLLPLLQSLPNEPVVWFLGNTTKGYEEEAAALGKERVVGGFPGVGGTWKGDTLVFADRKLPEDEPFNSLIVGEPYPHGSQTASCIHTLFTKLGFNVTYYNDIFAWHLSHAALILPLAAHLYNCGGDIEKAAADFKGITRAMKGVKEAFSALEQARFPLLPKSFKSLRYFPAWAAAIKTRKTLNSAFGRIALASHAETAKTEMQSLAEGLKQHIDGSGRPHLQEVFSILEQA